MSRNAQLKRRSSSLLTAAMLWITASAPAPAQTHLLSPALALASQSPERAMVYTVEDPEATEAFQPQIVPIRKMVTLAVINLTGQSNATAAWLSLVSTQDTVGIKVNSEPGPNSGTRQAVAAAVVEGLLSAGLSSNRIIVWDKRLVDLRLSGFTRLTERYGIRLAGSADAGYDENVFYETSLIGNLVWGDFEFSKKGDGVGRRSFVSKLVSQEMTKIINITPLMNHNQAGVAGVLFGLALGSVDNTKRFENESSRLATAVPEIYALPALGDRVVLNIVDALICQYEGEEKSLLHYSTPLNQLRFSRDPVALDVLSIQELNIQRQRAGTPPVRPIMDLYSNATLLELGISDLSRIRVIELR